MKVNELLRRLENVEPVENFDSERREIAEHIAQVFFKIKKVRHISYYVERQEDL